MPVLLLILACALWAVSFPVIKALELEQSARLGPLPDGFLAVWLQTARFSLAALIMLPVLIHRRPTRSEIIQGAWLALWGGLGMALQAWGLPKTEASTSAFLTQAYCVILPLIACVRTRSAPSLRVIVATVMVLAGGAILAGVNPQTLKIGDGELATLAAAFIFTFQILTLENPKYEGNRGLVVTFAMSAWIAVLFLPLSLVLAPAPEMVIAAGASWPAFALILALALLCSVGAYGLMNSWQPRVSSTEAGLIYTTEPLFTAIFVMFLPVMLGRMVGHPYPNESLTRSLIYGGSLILAANVLMQWKRPPHPPAIAPAP
ncbi:DMT family transporter [Luteolibacter sp. Populi]|uniref:DMT family transporter n=1 Tax=Luteolibacter sp. Populi TaxID=3230487 RepID=UPI0034651E64